MKTHCKFGHPRTPENLRGFACKICEKARQIARLRRLGSRPMEEYRAIRRANRKTHCDAGHPLDPKQHGCKVCEKFSRARARELKEPTQKLPQTQCVKGHPKGYFGACKVCKRETKRRYNKAHPEKRQAIKRGYFLRHPEAVLKRREKSREWAKNNPEKVKAYSKAHPRKPRTAEENRAHQHRRRARKTGAGGSYTLQEEKNLRDLYNSRCVCCWRTETELTTLGLIIVLDHVVPVSKGGTSFISNMQPLCHHKAKGTAGCNEYKGDFHDTDYRLEGLLGVS